MFRAVGSSPVGIAWRELKAVVSYSVVLLNLTWLVDMALSVLLEVLWSRRGDAREMDVLSERVVGSFVLNTQNLVPSWPDARDRVLSREL